jgi:hypothetical protein
MARTPARPERRQPPSTPGTSERRARRWPLPVGLLALGAIAVAAPMVAADPASAPVQPTAAAAPGRAGPGDHHHRSRSTEDLRRFNEAEPATRPPSGVARCVPSRRRRPAARPSARSGPEPRARLAEEARKAEAARQEAAARRRPAAAAGRLRPLRRQPAALLGDERESGGNITAKNPTSTRLGQVAVHQLHLGRLRRLRRGLDGPRVTSRTPRPPSCGPAAPAAATGAPASSPIRHLANGPPAPTPASCRGRCASGDPGSEDPAGVLARSAGSR